MSPKWGGSLQNVDMLQPRTGLQYFLTDHLGSVVAVTDASGTLIAQQRYLPFGGERTNVGSISQTDYGYTGQRDLDPGMGGLMDYKARFYSPYLNHMTQPDSIVPNPYNSQDWNRYSYARNNPIRYTDPSGHSVDCGIGDPYCSAGEYTPGGLMQLYKPNKDNSKTLNKEIDDYLRKHEDYNYKDDPYLGFSIGDNRDLKYEDLRLQYWQDRLKDSGVCTSDYFCVDAAEDLYNYYDLHQEGLRGEEFWDSSKVNWASVTLDIVSIPLAFTGRGIIPNDKALGRAGFISSTTSLATAKNPMYALIAVGSYIPVAGAFFDVNLLVWDLSDGITDTTYTPPISR